MTGIELPGLQRLRRREQRRSEKRDVFDQKLTCLASDGKPTERCDRARSRKQEAERDREHHAGTKTARE